jgi:hypothetical protein
VAEIRPTEAICLKPWVANPGETSGRRLSYQAETQ